MPYFSEADLKIPELILKGERQGETKQREHE